MRGQKEKTLKSFPKAHFQLNPGTGALAGHVGPNA